MGIKPIGYLISQFEKKKKKSHDENQQRGVNDHRKEFHLTFRSIIYLPYRQDKGSEGGEVLHLLPSGHKHTGQTF